MMPARRLLLAVAAWMLLGLAASIWPPLLPLWYGAGALLLLAACADALLARRAPPPWVERRLAGVWSVDHWHEAGVVLHNAGPRPLRVELFDGYPPAWEMEGLPYTGSVDAGAHIAVSYRLRPRERGDAIFDACWLRVTSPLALWQRRCRVGTAQTVKVFPDFSRLMRQTLSATDRRVPSVGALRRRQRGEGTDFRQLREYRQGDSLRSIDWKASARQNKPISREYQEERDQQVVFLLDTGRRMLARDADRSHFDHALDAVLTLGFLVQKQGDAIGLMTFGADQRWLAPHKGRGGLDRLLAGVYDAQPSEAASDYVQAATLLLQKLDKRAFVVVITNLRDEDDRTMRDACRLLGRRHMVLCASLRELALDQACAAPVAGFAGALRQTAAALYLQQRQEALRRLGLDGGQLIDVAPAQLSRALTKRYLDIKESGRL